MANIFKNEIYNNTNCYFSTISFNNNSDIECEFLLNMGALLRCVDINIIYDFQGYYIKGYNIPKKEYTEYTYKFIGWNQDYTERINSSMSKYITYLRSEAI